MNFIEFLSLFPLDCCCGGCGCVCYCTTTRRETRSYQRISKCTDAVTHGNVHLLLKTNSDGNFSIFSRIWDRMVHIITDSIHRTALRPMRMAQVVMPAAVQHNGSHQRAFQFHCAMRPMPMDTVHSVVTFPHHLQSQNTSWNRLKRIVLQLNSAEQRASQMINTEEGILLCVFDSKQ